jgi:hypothetical protein
MKSLEEGNKKDTLLKLLGLAMNTVLPSIQRILKPAFRIQPIRKGETPPYHTKKFRERMVN